MVPQPPVSVVLDWQDAAGRQDIDRLLELSDPDIELGGPRGSGHGHQLLREWLGRAGLRLTTLRLFAQDNVVVTEQRGAWRSTKSGEDLGEQIIASCFQVQDGRVVRYVRYDSLETALSDTGLTEADVTPLP